MDGSDPLGSCRTDNVGSLDADVLNAAAGMWWSEPHSYAVRASGGRWSCYPYLALIGREISRAVNRGMAGRGGGKIIVNVPPRHGKSEFISRFVPQWFLANYPTRHVLLTSYSKSLPYTYGRMVRNELEASTAAGLTTTRLTKDKRQQGHWLTNEGGGMLCAGVGGGITGYGGHLCLIDDPIKNWEDAWSDTKRQKCVDWYNSTFSTREEPGATTVLLMTRWHPYDLTGHLLDSAEANEWKVFRFPAIAKENDPLGRAPGEALVPERYDADWGRRKRLQVGEMVWESVYQQDPTAARGGRLFSRYSDENVTPDAVFRDDLPLAITFDFNINPGMHVLGGHHDPRADVFTFASEIHEPRLDVRSAMELVNRRWVDPLAPKWKTKGRMLPVHIYGDPSGASESITRSESGYDIIRASLRMRKDVEVSERVAKKSPKPIDIAESANDALLGLDGVRRVRIHPSCVRLITDLRNVMPDKEGGPDKGNPLLKHASDAACYWIWFVRPIGGTGATELRGGVVGMSPTVRIGSGLPGMGMAR